MTSRTMQHKFTKTRKKKKKKGMLEWMKYGGSEITPGKCPGFHLWRGPAYLT